MDNVVNKLGDRVRSLDALRGLAALGVLGYHYFIRYPELFGSDTPKGPFGYGLYLPLVFAWLFFLISGYAIYRSVDQNQNLAKFISRRFARLYPTYWAGVILTIVLIHVLPSPLLANAQLPGALLNLTMVQEWLGAPMLDTVYWSLVIQLAFYGFIALLLAVRQIRHIEVIGLAYLILQWVAAFGQRLLHRELPLVVIDTFFIEFFHIFFAGILFHRIEKYGLTWHRASLLALTLITQWVVYGRVATLELLIYLVTFYLALSGRLDRFLQNRLLLFFGAISYSLYLVQADAGYSMIHFLVVHRVPNFVAVAITTALAIGVASLLTGLIERPANKLFRSRLGSIKDQAPLAGCMHPEHLPEKGHW